MPFFILILIRHRISCTDECDCRPEQEPAKGIHYERQSGEKKCSFLLLPRSSRLLSFLIRNGENSHSKWKRDSRPMHTNDSRFKFLCFIQSFVALLTLLRCFFFSRSERSIRYAKQMGNSISSSDFSFLSLSCSIAIHSVSCVSHPETNGSTTAAHNPI